MIKFEKQEHKQLTLHFNSDELECHCNTKHTNSIHQGLLEKLEALRKLVGGAIKVNCAYRCETHNQNIGGVKDSQHLRGFAADIVVPGLDTLNLYGLACKAGFNGVGLYDNFVHVDVRPGPFTTWRG